MPTHPREDEVQTTAASGSASIHEAAASGILCPGCASSDVRRSQLRKLEDWCLLPGLFIPYRCRNCHRRFHHNVVWSPPRIHTHRLSWAGSRWRRAARLRRRAAICLFVVSAVYVFLRLIAQTPAFGG